MASARGIKAGTEKEEEVEDEDEDVEVVEEEVVVVADADALRGIPDVGVEDEGVGFAVTVDAVPPTFIAFMKLLRPPISGEGEEEEEVREEVEEESAEEPIFADNTCFAACEEEEAGEEAGGDDDVAVGCFNVDDTVTAPSPPNSSSSTKSMPLFAASSEALTASNTSSNVMTPEANPPLSTTQTLEEHALRINPAAAFHNVPVAGTAADHGKESGWEREMLRELYTAAAAASLVAVLTEKEEEEEAEEEEQEEREIAVVGKRFAAFAFVVVVNKEGGLVASITGSSFVTMAGTFALVDAALDSVRKTL